MSWLEAEAVAARRKVKQVAKAKLDLEVTPNFRIGVAVYIKSKLVGIPSLKKKDVSTGGAVRLDRTYVRMDDPDMSVEEKMLALRYGSEYVSVPSERVAQLRVGDASKCLKVLGFFTKSTFPSYRLISGCDCVAAEPGNPNAAIALSALIHALVETGKVALCRFSARDGSEPKLVVLHPHAERDFECFYSVQAPFSEDSREATLLFAPLPTPTNELLRAVNEFVSSRCLESLRLEDVVNPTIHRFWRLVQERAKDDTATVPDLEQELYDLLHPEIRLFDSKESKESLDKLLALRPLVEAAPQSEVEKKKRRYWREIYHADLVRSPQKNIDVKKIRIEETAVSGPSQVSTQAESQGDVRDLVLKGDIKNAVTRIIEIRESCVNRKDAKEFNQVLRNLEDIVETHPRLWRELIVAGVTLISSDEVSDSAVNPKEATKFLEEIMKRV